jgi:hypothetical protein
MRPIEDAATITRRCAAIRYAHRLADLEPPTNSGHVRATLRGIRRTVGAQSAKWKAYRGGLHGNGTAFISRVVCSFTQPLRA